MSNEDQPSKEFIFAFIVICAMIGVMAFAANLIQACLP